jgi:phosphoribosylamine--glycine ligase
MKILLVGGGGREHALAWRLAQSKSVTEIVCAPGNPGIAEIARLAPIKADDINGLTTLAVKEKVDLVVVGPETPLALGLTDRIEAVGIPVFGPSQKAAQVEASKAFTKDLCARAGAPTAASETFRSAAPAKAFLDKLKPPYVIKADGLAAGKGVVIAESWDAANAAVDACFEGIFGAAGAEIVIEEFLDGEEVSFFALCDGEHVLPLATAQDHKRVGDGDTGPNTGGMGAYSPAPVMTPEMTRRTMDEIIRPTVAGMRQRGTPFKGVLFLGVMITADGPKLYEYNARFGDPETQVLMMRLKSDLLAALLATADGVLSTFDLRWSEDAALTVVMAANGYPGDYEKGTEIRGLEAAGAIDGVEIFHAGTVRRDGRLLASGGRVLNVSARGRTVAEAQARAYAAIDLIDWPDGFCRRDIGWRAIAREAGAAHEADATRGKGGR